MPASDQIRTGRVTFSTDDFFIQFTVNGAFVDLSGEATSQSNFSELTYNHQQVSVLGHMGDRSLTGDPNSGLRVASFIASRIVLKQQIELRAFEIYKANEGGSALDHWLRAERELLGLETEAAHAAAA